MSTQPNTRIKFLCYHGKFNQPAIPFMYWERQSLVSKEFYDAYGNLRPLLNFDFEVIDNLSDESDMVVYALEFRRLVWVDDWPAEIEFIDIFNSDVRSNMGFVPAEVWDAIRKRKAVLVIDDKTEGFRYERRNFEKLFGLLELIVETFQIPAESLLFITCNFRMEEEYFKYIALKNAAPKVKIVAEDYFQQLAINSSEGVLSKPLPPNKIEKTFLSLNRHFNPYRQYLVFDYWLNGLTDGNLISLNDTYNVSWVNTAAMFDPNSYTDFIGDSDISPYMDNVAAFVATLPLVVDLHDFNINQLRVLDPTIYRKTLLSVVNETNSEHRSLYLTEKIYKTIAIGHPFMLMGDMDALKYLRSLGYKTYSDFFDESYDDAQTLHQRKTCILNELKRLDSLSLEQKQKMSDDMVEIATFNREVLKNNFGKYGTTLEAAIQHYFGVKRYEA